MVAMLLSKAIEGFLIARTAEFYSPDTLDIYKWALKLMSDYLSNPEVKSITPSDVQRFYVWLQTEYKPKRTNGDDSPLKPRSIENAWTAIRSFFNWATIDLKLKSRPDTNLKRPRYKPAEITPFSPEDVRALLKACEYMKSAQTNGRKTFVMRRDTAYRDTAIVLVLLDTGLRVSEASRLRVRDMNPVTGEVFVDAFGSGRKTKSRHVYLGKVAMKAVWRYLADREDLLPDDNLFLTREDRPMDRNSIRLVVNELGKRAGVNGVHPHRFRHTMAVQYLRNSGDVFTLQRLLGHSTLEMVQHYLSLAQTDVQAAHRKASPADRWHL
jgi:integrase/recombinase XerD